MIILKLPVVLTIMELKKVTFLANCAQMCFCLFFIFWITMPNFAYVSISGQLCPTVPMFLYLFYFQESLTAGQVNRLFCLTVPTAVKKSS